MAKKQNISDTILNKFNKPQFQSGAAVCFYWMGRIQYGYVTTIKQASWGVQYMVQSCHKTRYPCGLEYEGQKTQYYTGYIDFTTTKALGPDELIRRIQIESNARTITTVSLNTGRPKDQSGDDDPSSRPNARKPVAKGTKSKSRQSSREMVDQPSVVGVHNSVATKPKVPRKSKLDDAIEKQRNFLSGFVKKD